MILVTAISVFLLVAAVVELLLKGMPRLQSDWFNVVVAVTAVLFTSKYYYGPDITTYVPLYESIGKLAHTLAGHYPTSYEVGFVYFCSFCKTLGLSYWGMTAVVSVLLFAALYGLISKLDSKKTLALAVIVILLPDLLYAQFRQAMAVALFIFSVLTADKRQFGWAMVLAVLAVTMHKSAVFVVVPTIFYYTLQSYEVKNSAVEVMGIVLVIMLVVSMQSFVEQVVNNLPLPKTTAKSLKMHASFSKAIQSNFVLYFMAIILMAHFGRRASRTTALLASVMVGMMMIVAFYQFYYLLNRLRSYFVPMIVVYILREGHVARENKVPYAEVVSQAAILLMLLFMGYKTIAFDKNSRKDGDVLMMSTVFELVSEDKEDLQERQMKRAEDFWDNAFLKGDREHRSKNYVEQYKEQEAPNG